MFRKSLEAILRCSTLPRSLCTLLVVALLGVTHSGVRALGLETHRLVNMQAARLESSSSMNFDSLLRDGLGLAGGRATLLRASGRSLTIEEWLGEGGEREDDFLRSLRHFHDPLQPW